MVSLRRLLRYMGVRGAFKSLYNTIRQSSVILCTPKSIISIDQSASVTGAPIVLGYTGANESHPLQSRTLLGIGADSNLTLSGDSGALIGPGSVLRSDGSLVLGDCFINSNTKIICEEEVKVGDDTSISWNVTILDSDRHTIIKDGSESQKTSPVHIEENVLIGHSATISKGVTIAEGAIVAAGSVVVDNVPSHKIVAGNPATVIDSVDRWD